MRLDGEETTDAGGGTQSKPPAFQIIVLVRTRTGGFFATSSNGPVKGVKSEVLMIKVSVYFCCPCMHALTHSFSAL